MPPEIYSPAAMNCDYSLSRDGEDLLNARNHRRIFSDSTFESADKVFLFAS